MIEHDSNMDSEPLLALLLGKRNGSEADHQRDSKRQLL